MGLYSHRRRLEAWNIMLKKKRDCTVRVAKTNALITCAVADLSLCFRIGKNSMAHRQTSDFLMTRLLYEKAIWLDEMWKKTL